MYVYYVKFKVNLFTFILHTLVEEESSCVPRTPEKAFKPELLAMVHHLALQSVERM